ncbi:MAG: hypothetical protein MJK04_01640 [Psychrosphaera sp.]|nr:hypothetical protein [Psychrosphaera sp.]
MNKIQTNKNDQTSATLTNKKDQKRGFRTNLSAGPRGCGHGPTQGISMGGGDK